jgi:hypothetical protein
LKSKYVSEDPAVSIIGVDKGEYVNSFREPMSIPETQPVFDTENLKTATYLAFNKP